MMSQWFPTWVDGPLGGPRTAVGGPQDLKICITVNGKGYTNVAIRFTFENGWESLC